MARLTTKGKKRLEELLSQMNLDCDKQLGVYGWHLGDPIPSSLIIYKDLKETIAAMQEILRVGE